MVADLKQDAKEKPSEKGFGQWFRRQIKLWKNVSAMVEVRGKSDMEVKKAFTKEKTSAFLFIVSFVCFTAFLFYLFFF